MWTVTVLVGVLAVGPFLLPVPDQDGFDEQELAGPADRFVTIEGVDVRIRQAGDGPVIFTVARLRSERRQLGAVREESVQRGDAG